jgi:hypothetical protein
MIMMSTIDVPSSGSTTGAAGIAVDVGVGGADVAVGVGTTTAEVGVDGGMEVAVAVAAGVAV